MKKHILIIEDEEDMVRGLKINLVDEGYEVDYALNGKVGLEKALAEKPDLILLDIMLPGMNGLEVFQAILLILRILVVHPGDPELDFLEPFPFLFEVGLILFE